MRFKYRIKQNYNQKVRVSGSTSVVAMMYPLA